MATEVKRRRGTTAQHATFTGAEAELTVDTDKWTVLVHDDSGSAPTGHELLRQDFSNVTTLKVDTTYSETGNEVQGEMYWNSDEETVSLVTNGSTLELGHKTEVHVRNDDPEQATIDKGSVVSAYGTIGNSGRIKVKKFEAGQDDTKTVIGITDEDIAYEEDGKAIVFGKIRKIDTATPESGTWQEGDILYASSTAGALTKTQPAAGSVELPIAYVVTRATNVGEIFVRVTPIDENAYQPYDADLSTLGGLSKADGNFIVGNGSAWVAESGATVRTSLGLGNVEDTALSTYTGENGALDNQYITNGAGYITGYTETDPVFSASEAASITSTDTTQWDAAYTYSQVGHLPLTGGTISSDLTISGNLTVSGTTTTVNSTSVTVADNNLTLNAGEAGAGVTQATSGIVVDRGTEADFAFLFVESDDKFKIGTSGNLQTVATRQDDGTAVDGGVMFFNNTDKRLDNSANATLDSSGNLTLAGTISANGYNKSNWDTAYGWGDHASAGYLTSYTETDTLSDVTGRGASTSDTISIDKSSASAGNAFRILGAAGNIDFSYTGTQITFSAASTITAGANDLTLAGNQVVVDTSLYVDSNATVTGSITSGSFIKDGGTSSQFLKADGSVDSNTYLTSLPTHNHNNLYYTELEINEFLDGTNPISGYNKSNWDTAFGWGNHASAGYLTSIPSEYLTQTEGDDRYLQLTGGTLTGDLVIYKDKPHIELKDNATNDPVSGTIDFLENANSWGTAGSYGMRIQYDGDANRFEISGLSNGTEYQHTTISRDAGNYVTSGTMTAASFTKSSNSGGFLKADGTEDTNTYLTSYTETDPVFSASAASGITSTNISNWNLAYNNHITAVGFNTSTGVLTLTQNDTGTITVDLDGRYLTTETGDIQGVTAGNGLSGGGTSGTVTLAVDFSELPSNPAVSIDTTDQIIWYETGSGTENRTNISSFPLSKFNNDSGFTSNVGDITAVTAGTGISGGGTSGSVTVSHATTSTLEGSYGSTSNGTKIDSITVDPFGHVTAISTGAVGDITGVTAGTGLSGGGTSGTVTLNVSGLTTSQFSASTILNSAETFTSSDAVIMTSAAIESYVTGLGYTTNTGDITGVTAGSGISGGGTSGTVTISHEDTSSQGSVNNTGGTVIQDVTLDTYGHVTGLVSYNLDGRYYTESEADGRFVNVTGDTMSGDLTINGTLSATVKSFNIVHPTQEGKRLVYGVLEGAEHAVFVRGRSQSKIIELPEEWRGLVDQDSITVQLTAIGNAKTYYFKGCKDNKVYVGSSGFNWKYDYFYIIHATRVDVEPLQTVQDAN